MAEPGCGTCPPGGPCIPCTTATIKVTVYLQTVCWDTDRTLGLNSPDRLFTGVNVKISGSCPDKTIPTDGAGTAIFEALPVPGSYHFEVTKEHFEDVSEDASKNPPIFPADIAPIVRTDVTLNSDSDILKSDVGKTKEVLRVMRREKLECMRKHSVLPGAQGPSGTTLGPILWQDEPGILKARDVVFLLCVFLAVIVLLIGLVTPAPYANPDPSGPALLHPGISPGAAAVVGIFLGFVAYLGMVIFGMGFGIPALIIAFLYFGVLTVVTMVSAAAAFLGLPPADPFGYPALAAMWIGFSWGFIIGRREKYNSKHWIDLIISLILGAVLAVVLFILLAIARGVADSVGTGGMIGLGIVMAILGAILGLVAGLLGLAFRNEGRTKMDFTIKDFLLPYSGERYCVQSHRGWISHYFRRDDRPGYYSYDEEPSYDWSMPEGEPILCCKEGHITAYKDTAHGNVRGSYPVMEHGVAKRDDSGAIVYDGNSDPNYVAVRHYDKTTAKYLHLLEGGIAGPGWNEGLEDRVGTHVDENTYFRSTPDPNPLHVHPGQVLGANGDTGISMFPHLHLFVMKPSRNPDLKAEMKMPDDLGKDGPCDPAPDTFYMAFKFSDADVGGHDGQCWAMRKYTSSNVNRGKLVLAPNQAPFNPGGTPTDGGTAPFSPPPAAPGAAPGLPGLPDVTPPLPPGAGAPAPPPPGAAPPTP